MAEDTHTNTEEAARRYEQLRGLEDDSEWPTRADAQLDEEWRGR